MLIFFFTLNYFMYPPYFFLKKKKTFLDVLERLDSIPGSTKKNCRSILSHPTRRYVSSISINNLVAYLPPSSSSADRFSRRFNKFSWIFQPRPPEPYRRIDFCLTCESFAIIERCLLPGLTYVRAPRGPPFASPPPDARSRSRYSLMAGEY